MGASRTIFFLEKTASQSGPYSKHVEVIPSHQFAADAVRLTIQRQVHRALRVCRQS